MTRRQFLATITADEYTELRALAQLERIGLERTDHYATALAQAAGAEIDEQYFHYKHIKPKTLDEEAAALAGVVKRKK